MKRTEKNKVLFVNAMLWIVAALAHPVSHLIPTGSGEPPKILPLLIFWMFLMLGYASTAMLSKALGDPADEKVE